jgi:hypothetical protein
MYTTQNEDTKMNNNTASSATYPMLKTDTPVLKHALCDYQQQTNLKICLYWGLMPCKITMFTVTILFEFHMKNPTSMKFW